MDIDGIKRRRTAYRSPRLSVVVRTVEYQASVPSRPGANVHLLENFIITDVAQAKKPVTTHDAPGPVVTPLPKVAAEQISTEPSVTSVKSKNGRRFGHLLYVAAALVLAVGGLLAYRATRLNAAVEDQVQKLQAASTNNNGESGSSSLPTDTKPADPNYLQNYKVAPQLPQLLTINKIGLTARILQVGVDKNNQMEVPKTAYDVAWYNGSSRPGENGAMVIDGHVQGVGGGAVFTDLKKLVIGDAIEVQRGDGKHFYYTVVKVETVPVASVDTGKLLVSSDTNRPGLNLITCAGDYSQQSGSFDSRTIVYTLQQ